MCREYHDLLMKMIPKFESCSTSPKQEHVSKVQDALLFTQRLFDGLIAMNDPSTETLVQPKATGEPTPGGATVDRSDQDELKPPEPADAKALEEYIPKIKRILYKRSTASERGEVQITVKYKTYFNSALADLNVLYRWKEVPTKAKKGQDLEKMRHTVITANKLREMWYITRILEPWIVNKKTWEEYKIHNQAARTLGEELEKSKDVSSTRWKKIADELAWYATNIGEPVQMFEVDEPKNQVSDVDDNDHDDSDTQTEPMGEFPLQTILTDDDSARLSRQDIGTNTGAAENVDIPLVTADDENEANTPSATTEKVDKNITTTIEEKDSLVAEKGGSTGDDDQS